MSVEDQITAPVSAPVSAARAEVQVQQYLDRVKELIPTEVAAAFLAINSFVPLNSDDQWYVFVFFGILLVACGLYMRIKKASLLELCFVTFVAFPAWALNIAVARFDSLIALSFVPACALTIVTVFSPLIPKQDGQKAS